MIFKRIRCCNETFLYQHIMIRSTSAFVVVSLDLLWNTTKVLPPLAPTNGGFFKKPPRYGYPTSTVLIKMTLMTI